MSGRDYEADFCGGAEVLKFAGPVRGGVLGEGGEVVGYGTAWNVFSCIRNVERASSFVGGLF